MEKDKEQEKKIQPVTYYGKKVYCLNPLLACIIVKDINLPDYHPDNLKEKR